MAVKPSNISFSAISTVKDRIIDNSSQKARAFSKKTHYIVVAGYITD